MSSTTVQEAVMAAREAHEALLNLKILAERAAHQIRTAEHRAIGLAVANPPKESPLGTLRAAAASVPSSESRLPLRRFVQKPSACCVLVPKLSES